MNSVIIVGAGHAGVELAAALRQRRFAGAIDLVSDEGEVPYQRPPLSKDYIKRLGSPLVLRPAKFYEEQKIGLRLGVSVAAIDRAVRSVILSNGEVLAYDHLVLATGARNRRPPVPGIDHHDILQLRSLTDARDLAKRIRNFRRIVVIGGGFVGLEAAGLLRLMGIEVDVVEMAPRLMQRAVSPTVSEWFLKFHHDSGVGVHLSRQVEAVEHCDGRVNVLLAGGVHLEADAVLLAAGVMPNVELAAAAGLEINNGVVVDDFLATSDPAISAIGDCAVYPSIHLPGPTRLESVQNACDHARTLAARLTGTLQPYDALPWFWSVQGAARLQIAGLTKPGLTEVVRGDIGSGRFSVFLLDDDRLQAAETVNSPADHMLARRLIVQGARLDPMALADNSVELSDL
ncbi:MULTISPECIES: FAD-dependent oxidoreductase [unclassified Chelatococcus]|uniref:NAD(P)/FAD-dependent oxidoreductase n=1 Tax=unclassified Chelatococcus TaxID=2638111 RepID=UPI001BD1A6C5|nr:MULTISPECIES: FAD-dependent oxidoreductase [unclassified Chelatococcus]MBS7743742.1 FAD-dependent oxidoreductase [Chelatococcus sp. HY11]MBX3547256.1 FAD-dependent oxidoreductase [Chelatococcus sp.]CAH1664851.1 Rhodocoxin reductase [Hyphomicrobiales bacterium]CAH1688514.1 Rhodocoxin reductase [Hyphomicrobiales bacterium]